MRALFLAVLFFLFILAACQVENPFAAPTVTPPALTNTPEPTATSPPAANSAAGFSRFLAEAEGSPLDRRQALSDRYIAQLDTVPVTGPNQGVFLWRGEAQRVQLVGDMNNWALETASELSRLPGTDLWYLIVDLETDARLDYKYVIDGARWQLDPLNPRTIMSSFGPNSELMMPGYATPRELAPAQGVVPAGTLTRQTLESAALNQTRTFFVYQPAGQLVGQKLATVVIHDGGDFLNIIDTPAILDRLIANQQVPPLMAVFIPPISREQEYSLNDAYVTFLADELVPFVQQNFGTDPDPKRTAVLGASMGGLGAVHAALTRPDVFALAAGQSGAYSVSNNALTRLVAAGNRSGPTALGNRFYLVVGTYESAVNGNAQIGNLLAANRRLVEALEAGDFEFRYEERPEGHSWGLWRGTLGRALAYLFPFP
jgi:enterochelin esterase-like enzyme